jgi:hypothetical protein
MGEFELWNHLDNSRQCTRVRSNGKQFRRNDKGAVKCTKIQIIVSDYAVERIQVDG